MCVFVYLQNLFNFFSILLYLIIEIFDWHYRKCDAIFIHSALLWAGSLMWNTNWSNKPRIVKAKRGRCAYFLFHFIINNISQGHIPLALGCGLCNRHKSHILRNPTFVTMCIHFVFIGNLFLWHTNDPQPHHYHLCVRYLWVFRCCMHLWLTAKTMCCSSATFRSSRTNQLSHLLCSPFQECKLILMLSYLIWHFVRVHCT